MGESSAIQTLAVYYDDDVIIFRIVVRTGGTLVGCGKPSSLR